MNAIKKTISGTLSTASVPSKSKSRSWSRSEVIVRIGAQESILDLGVHKSLSR
jgi:hypothetical protein